MTKVLPEGFKPSERSFGRSGGSPLRQSPGFQAGRGPPLAPARAAAGAGSPLLFGAAPPLQLGPRTG
eukprot:10303120-Heterocapsa_arctica.AAC.1